MRVAMRRRQSWKSASVQSCSGGAAYEKITADLRAALKMIDNQILDRSCLKHCQWQIVFFSPKKERLLTLSANRGSSPGWGSYRKPLARSDVPQVGQN